MVEVAASSALPMRHISIIHKASPAAHSFSSVYHPFHFISRSKLIPNQNPSKGYPQNYVVRQWTNNFNNSFFKLRQRCFSHARVEAGNLGDKSPEAKANVDGSGSIVDGLIDFLNESWTQFHATAEARRLLLAAGFHQLKEQDEWDLQPGGCYFFTRNMSCLIAFAIGEKYVAGKGFHAIAAHTDSPCPKLKPVSAASKSGYLNVNVQPYGAGLWHTWFDRDLSVAGRAILRTEDGAFSHKLVKVKRPILRIPTLAIHLNRSVNTDGFKPNLETHFIPLLASQIKADLSSVIDEENQFPPSPRKSHHSLLLQVLAEELGCNAEDIADFELNVCDTQSSCLGGARNEFIFSGRLDNLASCFCALRALLDSCRPPVDLSDESHIRMVALFDSEELSVQVRNIHSAFHSDRRRITWIVSRMCLSSDHRLLSRMCLSSDRRRLSYDRLRSFGRRCVTPERVGSNSAYGAGAPTMFQAMKRITESLTHGFRQEGIVQRAIQQSFLVSADMAHGVHPNYSEKHEDHHQPKLQKGVVIKHNANQRYATNVVTSFLFKEVANAHHLPCQDFVVRNDMVCGSTIGPILASGVGIRTVDCGIPQLSMHSVREMCGKEDIDFAYKHFKAFYQTFSDIDDKLSVDC